MAILTPSFFAAEIAVGRLVQPFDIVARSGASFWLVIRRSVRILAKFVRSRNG